MAPPNTCHLYKHLVPLRIMGMRGPTHLPWLGTRGVNLNLMKRRSSSSHPPPAAVAGDVIGSSRLNSDRFLKASTQLPEDAI